MARDLLLRVGLQTLDRASRPLRAIASSSIGLGRGLKDTRAELKGLQTQQRDVSSFRALKGEADKTGSALQASRDRVKALSRELATHAQALRPLEASYEALSGQTAEASAKHQDLTRRLRQTRQETREANRAWQQNRLRIRELGQQLANNVNPTQKLRDEHANLIAKQREQLDLVRRLTGEQKELTQQQRASGTSAREHRERLADLNNQLREAKAPMQGLNQQFRQGVREATNLKQKHSEQQRELQGLRGKLSAAGISTRNLGQHERELRSKISATNQALTQQENRLKRVTAQQQRLGRAKQQYEKTQGLAGSMAGSGAGALAAGTAMGAPIIGMASSYMSFEDAMLGVAKQVSGARDDNGQLTATYYEMGDAIKKMAERIPMATTEIAALVEGGARMGVQGKGNLLAFAEVAANAATAFELPADQIGENLARIADLYKLPIRNVGQLGDAINYLDDNAKSKGADIIEVMQRTAGITASVGMSFKDAAALGSTFLTLGASAEVAGTATNAMIRELAIATQQPKRFQAGLKAIGLGAENLQNGMAENATATLQQVLAAINKLPKAELLGVTTQLFGKEFGDDAAKLAQNVGEYRRQLELANSTAGAGSMQREADIRAEAMSARLDMAKNRAFNLSATLGETLRPTLVELFESFNNVLSGVSGWVKANPELTGQILKTVAGVAALAAGFGAITLAMASILGPFAMVRYGMAVFGIRGAGLASTLFSLGRSALPLVGRGILFISRALMMNPIGLAITAIAAGAYLIYKNWDRIGPYFLGLWAEIKQGFSGGLGGIAATILNFSPLGLFYRAFAGVMNYFGADMPARFTEFGGMLITGLVNGITNSLGRVKDAISGAGESTIGWFKEKLGIHSPSRVFAELGDFTMQGLAQGLTGGEAGPLQALTGIGKKLTQAGALALSASVGSGAIAMDNRAPLSANSGSQAVASAASSVTINVYPSAGMDEQALARLVAAELGKIQQRSQTRARSALSDQE